MNRFFFLSEEDKTRQSSLINVDNHFKRACGRSKPTEHESTAQTKKKLNHFSSFNFYSAEVNQTAPINSSISY